MISRSFRTACTALALFSLAMMPVAVAAQAPASAGRVVGRIIDAQSGAGLSDVGVQLVGTTLGVISGVDGRYAIGSVPAGTVTIQVRRIGYAPKTVTGLMLEAGEVLEQDIAMSPATVQLEAQVVTAAAERGTVSEALDRQRNATAIVSAVTAEQISRSPDGDAAQAVQRVSGVTVQDGRYVFVRGLGERYTTASLNGARLPSPEPERKVVPLDLFPAGLLQSVVTSKTFTPDQPGDFSGASVDLQTREFPARRQITYSMTAGYNTAATGKTVFAAPTVGSEWLGFAGSARRMPGPVAAAGNFAGSISQDQVNEIVSSFRNVWSSERRKGTPNSSMSVSVGGSDPLFGQRVGYLASASYAYAQEIRAKERTALADAIGSDRQTPYDEFTGETGRASVLWGGMLNISTLLGQGSRLALNNTYSRTADNEARVEMGATEDAVMRRSMLRFIERGVRSNQLLGEHQIGGRQLLDWSVTASGVTRNEPDRVDLIYRRELGEPDTAPFLLQTSGEGAVRTFSDLAETNYSAAANYRFTLGETGNGHVVKVGAAYRTTDRRASNLQYRLNATGLTLEDRALSPEQIFDGRFARAGDAYFQIEPVSRGGSYTAEDEVLAGYGMLELAFGGHVRVIGGARVEDASMTVTTELSGGSAVPSRVSTTDVLPSLVVNVKLGELQNLRLSATQTLARPEYRELSPINGREVIAGRYFQGNPDLKRTLIRNADVRWEWYPRGGEVLSLGVFAKRFQDPIERVDLAVSGMRGLSQQQVVNAEGADNYGVELEARKGLGAFSSMLAPLTVFANATLMRSSIDLGNDSISAATHEDRAMAGQAPYVLNAGLTYGSAGGNTSATLLYNVVGERIVAAGANPLPDITEAPRHVLDLSLRFPLMRSLSGRFDARNLLDAPYTLRQGTVTRERYESGRVFSLGVSWRQ